MTTKKVSPRASVTPKKKAALGTGVKVSAALAGAAALAAAGYYFFYGSEDGANHRKKVTAWSRKMKNEVIAEAKGLKELNKKTVGQLVKNISKAYGEVKSIDRHDLDLAVKELQRNWASVKQEAEKAVRAKVADAISAKVTKVVTGKKTVAKKTTK